MFENYYRILGISPDSDEKSLKKAFRKLALKLHPDVNPDPDANLRFQELCEAYEIVLRDIRKQTVFHTNRRAEPEEPDYSYEEVLREARAAAYERAKMKYEKMKAEKEMFEQSIWRDIFLFLNYAARIISIPLVIFLIGFPVVLAIHEGYEVLFFGMFFWLVGIFLLIQMVSYRKTWFRQGKLRWKLKDFLRMFDFSSITDHPDKECYYCEGRMADSKPFKLSFHKIRNIKLQNQGVYQHYVGYDRKFKDVIIPRSVRARKVHFAQSSVKIISMILCLIFLPFPDFIWKFCFGLLTGLVLSALILLIWRTHSKVSYLFTYFLILKLSVWMIVIISQTTLHPGFILECTDYTRFYIVVLVFFGDMVFDLILRAFPFYPRIYLPVFSQGPVIDKMYRDGYQSYLDVPVWSTVYPLFTWFV